MLIGGKLLFRRRIKEAAPHDFMRLAETAIGGAVTTITSEIESNLNKLSPE